MQGTQSPEERVLLDADDCTDVNSIALKIDSSLFVSEDAEDQNPKGGDEAVATALRAQFSATAEATITNSKSTALSTKSTSPSSLPAWLVSSFASVEKFKRTAAKTRKSIEHLQNTCKRFDEIKKKSDEYFAERERLLHARKSTTTERELAKIELLPTELYGKLFLYLASEDILEIIKVTKTLRNVFESEDDKCWQPLAAVRWQLKICDESWRLSCLMRCAGMCEINRLLKKYKREFSLFFVPTF
jgi:hypothetical protein